MTRYYTRVCNFYYGNKSKTLVKEKKTKPLNGNDRISFDNIEIITRNSKRVIPLKNINLLSQNLKKKIKKDIKIVSKKCIFKNLTFNSIPNIMGVLNVTPDSFSDGVNILKII